MGKTKLMAEKFIMSVKKTKKTKISIIRFGNVIGSRGSVVPNFIKLLKDNKNITVTDLKMTRFIMSLNEAVNSIFESIKIMKGGEIFILKSMKCFRIFDLASSLVKYFNKKNRKKSKIILSKKNIGEKLEEELYTREEIPFIEIKKKLFIIKKTKKNRNKNTINFLDRFRISNYNFLKEKEILKLLFKLRILK